VVVIIDYSKCKGLDCAECVNVCPMEVFKIEKDKVVVSNEDVCTFCMVCEDVCLENAIEVREE